MRFRVAGRTASGTDLAMADAYAEAPPDSYSFKGTIICVCQREKRSIVSWGRGVQCCLLPPSVVAQGLDIRVVCHQSQKKEFWQTYSLME